MAERTDEHAGQGGAYVTDPKTGKRKLIERTRIPESGSAPAAETPPAKPQTPED